MKGHGWQQCASTETQLQAAGSSLLARISHCLLLHALRLAGMPEMVAVQVFPVATGMTMTLAFLACAGKRPQAKYAPIPHNSISVSYPCEITSWWGSHSVPGSTFSTGACNLVCLSIAHWRRNRTFRAHAMPGNPHTSTAVHLALHGVFSSGGGVPQPGKCC